MRFLGKYELLEQLTVGMVETFAAVPIGGGERLLVHVFALPALVKSSPTNGDLLNYMQEVSPPALGSLVDAGRYDDGTQAFIVTKYPRDLDAIPHWVEAYKQRARKHDTTAEVVTRDLWEKDGAIIPAEPVVQKPVGDFTRAFQSVSPQKDPAQLGSVTGAFGEAPSGNRPAPLPTPPSFEEKKEKAPAPGSFTEQFMGLGEGARLPTSRFSSDLATPNEPVNAHIAKPPIAPPAPWAQPELPEPADERPKDPARAGEFTMFFRSPFADQPVDQTPLPPEPFNRPAPGPSKGDFTRIFGTSSPAGSAPASPEPLLEPPSQEEGNFTRIFGKAGPAPQTELPATPAVNPQPPNPTFKPELASHYVVSVNTNLPPVPQPTPGMAPPPGVRQSFDNPLGYGQDEGATRVFKPSAADVAPPPPSMPPGESEYTRIIRAGSPAPKPAEPAGGSPAAEVPFGSLPKVAVPMPPMQPIPHLAAPPPPPPPAPPAAMPGALKAGAGKLGAPKKGAKTSYIPLIVILNLFLLAAVCLVLYFVFKH